MKRIHILAVLYLVIRKIVTAAVFVLFLVPGSVSSVEMDHDRFHVAVDSGAQKVKNLEADSAPGVAIQVIPIQPPVPDPNRQPISPSVQTPDVRKYECPKTRYIDCMPPVTETAKPMCTKDYLEWANSHCTGFEVVY